MSDADFGFTYRLRKSGEVEIRRGAVVVTTLRGAAAMDFVAEASSSSPDDAQQLMARVTGNYKRGNERAAAAYPRNLKR